MDWGRPLYRMLRSGSFCAFADDMFPFSENQIRNRRTARSWSRTRTTVRNTRSLSSLRRQNPTLPQERRKEGILQSVKAPWRRWDLLLNETIAMPRPPAAFKLKETVDGLKFLEQHFAISIKVQTYLWFQAHVRQPFQNLIGNALKYRKETEPPLIKI